MESEEAKKAEAKRMMDFYQCLKRGDLIAFEASDELMVSEVDSAEYDLKRAEESLARDDLKWASIQAYHSMMHSVRVMVLVKGYKDETNQCLLFALKELYVATGELEKFIAENFEMCMNIRNECDRGCVPDKDSTKMCIEAAKNFLMFALKKL
jgi:uncharacterized protein (UPF0332 family)